MNGSGINSETQKWINLDFKRMSDPTLKLTPTRTNWVWSTPIASQHRVDKVLAQTLEGSL